jgi:hypothetical protein
VINLNLGRGRRRVFFSLLDAGVCVREWELLNTAVLYLKDLISSSRGFPNAHSTPSHSMTFRTTFSMTLWTICPYRLSPATWVDVFTV